MCKRGIASFLVLITLALSVEICTQLKLSHLSKRENFNAFHKFPFKATHNKKRIAYGYSFFIIYGKGLYLTAHNDIICI